MNETAHLSNEPSAQTAGSRGGLAAGLRQGVPTALVLAALGGLAYAGHRTGWTLPRAAALLGSRMAAPDDWCSGHGVPESICVECNSELLPPCKDYGWCKAHGVHNCPLEHPDIAQLKERANVPAGDLERAQRALALAARPENSSKCKIYQKRIQFASQRAFDRTGVDVEPVFRSPVAEFVTANGEATYDQTRIARLSARVPGTMWRVDKKVGDAVKAGEILALIEAPEVGRAKAEFLQASTQWRLKSETHQSLAKALGSVSEQRLREAAAALSEARIRLLTAQQALVNLGLQVDADDVKSYSERQLASYMQFLGLPAALRESLDARTTTANLLPLKAPLDGVVVSREVVAGEVVDTAKVLFIVADLRHLWLTLNVRQEEMGKVALGQPVRFRPNAGALAVNGTIAWISPYVDEKTRTVQVRADLPNGDGRLRAFTFGKGQIVLREEKDAVVVPNEAIHWEGDCFIVFVRDKDFLAENGYKVFHTRTVRLGAKDDKNTEIIAGVLPGEVIAAKGGGLLRAELLKSGLGEG